MGKAADWMGKIGDWLFRETFPEKAQRIEVLQMRLTQSQLLADSANDQLAAKTLELETLKNKIVERAQTPTTIKAKSAAEIRSLMERQAEREFEEQANGI